MKERINKLLHALNKDLFEREEVIQLALLSTLAGESIFLLGPPGVAKSLIARRIKEVFKGGKSFEYLMNRFSTPDEIFGPIAISKLKNEDKYERITDKYLPWADVVFLDEIWKAGPSIQNALLTVINEKVYRNGQQEISIPLKGLLAASNELPAKGEGLGALWDRFILRYLVHNISNPDNFNSYLTNSIDNTGIAIEESWKISSEEYQEWQTKIAKISISEEALNVVNVIRSYISKYNLQKETSSPIYVSDRRWKKIIKLLKTSAFLNNRHEIDLMDCFLIVHTIWDEVEQIEKVKEFVSDAIKNHGYSLKFNLSMFSEEIEDLKMDIQNETKIIKRITYHEPKEVLIKNVAYFELSAESISNPYYIKPSEYEKLKTTYQRVAICNENGFDNYSGSYNRHFEAHKKGANEIMLRMVEYRTPRQGVTHKLTTNKKTKSVTETNRPHSAILKEWNKRVTNITKELDDTIQEIELYKRKDLATLKENIFVNKDLAALPESNLNESIKTLLSEKGKVQKLKIGYDKL